VWTRIASVEMGQTGPGKCCVLFSKSECFGRPQKITGAVPDLALLDYSNTAHSVVCNVPQYCNEGAYEPKDNLWF